MMLIAGNWKMNKGKIDDAVALAREVRIGAYNLKGKVDIMVAPPFTVLSHVVDTLKGSRVKVGAQNMFYEDAGAYTGEISPDFLLDLGVEYVILGHSERRKFFHETDETVLQKALKAREKGLKYIVCVGETLEQREKGEAKDVVGRQVKAVLDGGAYSENLIFAYEPVWAIGTGKVATPELAQEMHGYIRDLLGENRNTLILYGGSVKPENAEGLLRMDDIDGALVGGASLNAGSFVNIIKIAEECV